MISFQEALKIVLENTVDFGDESVSLKESHHRILAESIYADRDFPPFDRVTKDGIAINFDSFQHGNKIFSVQEIAAAGDTEKRLKNPNNCIEVMTGAMLPQGADTVIMYEHLTIEDGKVMLLQEPFIGQNIHLKGSDEKKENLLLKSNSRITASEIGVLASVGFTKVKVKRLPKIGVVSTGNELVDIDETPEPHQIRKSNSFTLESALKLEEITCKQLHFNDVKDDLINNLDHALASYDVLLLSGGVSKGKFDFLPAVLKDLGVTQLFHRIKQRPGKPFWFGKSKNSGCVVFAFPGNPASTFANYHVYFLPWLKKSLGILQSSSTVILKERFHNATQLTRFIRASVDLVDGQLLATLVTGNGSGDLTSLCQTDGFILFEPLQNYEVGEVVQFYPTKRLL